MSALEHRLLEVNGIRLGLYCAGPEDGRPLWLLHGFPECWHSWRNQIEPLLAAGYRVLVPEMRGYGSSSAIPSRPDHPLRRYPGRHGRPRPAWACVIGHDWGAPVAWHLALLEPLRVKAVVGMAVPFGGRPKQPATEAMRQHFAGRFLHPLFPGAGRRRARAGCRHPAHPADDDAQQLRRRAPGLLPPGQARRLDPVRRHAGPRPTAGLVRQAAFAEYLKTFEGAASALNWYRNFERNWQRTEPASRCCSPPCS